jgi:DNA-binding NtrC family response regulator
MRRERGDPVQPVILLVDDETDLVEVLRDALELSMPEYRAVAATSAEGALSAMEHIRDDELAMICVDQRLGAASGLDLLRVARRRWPALPAMVFTGQSTPAIEAGARSLGARVVTKPLRLADWLSQVRAAIAER